MPFAPAWHGLPAPDAVEYPSTHGRDCAAAYQLPSAASSMSLAPHTVIGAASPATAVTTGDTTDAYHAWPWACICAAVRANPGTAAVRLLLVPAATMNGVVVLRFGLVS